MEWTREHLTPILEAKKDELCEIMDLMYAKVTSDGRGFCFIELHCYNYVDRKLIEKILGDVPFIIEVQVKGCHERDREIYKFKNEKGRIYREQHYGYLCKDKHDALRELLRPFEKYGLEIHFDYTPIYIVCPTPIPLDHDKIREILWDVHYKVVDKLPFSGPRYVDT